MEIAECTKVVLDKIQNIEPENATKTIGYLLLNYSHEEIMKFALGTEEQIISLINEAKTYLASSSKPVVLSPKQFSGQSSRNLSPLAISPPLSSPSSFRVPEPFIVPPSPTDYNRIFQTQAELAGFNQQLQARNPLVLNSLGYVYPDGQFGGGFGSRARLRSPNGLPEFPDKPCHYFFNGHCRLGNYCKFSHGQPFPVKIPQSNGLNPNEMLNDNPVFSSGALKQLDTEISELLRARKGMPIPMASLPSMYLEKYGKTLQVEGFLTESQQQANVVFTLPQLLGLLRSIRLIDRPHGQHAIVLVQDASRFVGRVNIGASMSSSHQIYLTFPAESSFTDQDVLNYFKQFGPVCDVRIPHQEKRMFGFVSFLYAETVRTILAMGHPHQICGSRVLVKPYKEKTRCERSLAERAQFPMFNQSQCFGMQPEPFAVPSMYENASLLKQQLVEEQDLALELERRRLLGLQLTPQPLASYCSFNYGMEEMKSPTDHFDSLAAQNNDSSSDDKPEQTAKSFDDDQDDDQIELPESPFASPHAGDNIYIAA